MENKEKIYPRIIEIHKASKDLMTASIAKGRGYTGQDEFECLRCGSPIKLSSLAEKGQKVHFRGNCHCNREVVEYEEKRRGWKKQDAIPVEGQVELEKSKNDFFNFIVVESESFEDLGYDIISNGHHKVAIIQESCKLNPALLGVHLVNEITPKGFKFIWSSRESKRLSELDDINSELSSKLETYEKDSLLKEKEISRLKKENEKLTKKNETVTGWYEGLKVLSDKDIKKYKGNFSKVKKTLKEEREKYDELKATLNSYKEEFKKVELYKEEINRLKFKIGKLEDEKNDIKQNKDWKKLYSNEIGELAAKNIKKISLLEVKLKFAEKECAEKDTIIQEKNKKIEKLRKLNFELNSKLN